MRQAWSFHSARQGNLRPAEKTCLRFPHKLLLKPCLLRPGRYHMEIHQQDALDYHRKGRKGKIEVVATKPCRTQWDLSLAYTPGVAVPCLEIARSSDLSFEYTARGREPPRRACMPGSG